MPHRKRASLTVVCRGRDTIPRFSARFFCRERLAANQASRINSRPVSTTTLLVMFGACNVLAGLLELVLFRF